MVLVTRITSLLPEVEEWCGSAQQRWLAEPNWFCTMFMLSWIHIHMTNSQPKTYPHTHTHTYTHANSTHHTHSLTYQRVRVNPSNGLTLVPSTWLVTWLVQALLGFCLVTNQLLGQQSGSEFISLLDSTLSLAVFLSRRSRPSRSLYNPLTQLWQLLPLPCLSRRRVRG